MDIAQIRNKLGKRVAFFRKQNKLSQEELAAKIDTSEDMISNIERAKTGVSFEVVVKIADVLQVSIDDLIEFNLGENTQTSTLIRELFTSLKGKDDKVLRFLVEQVKLMEKGDFK